MELVSGMVMSALDVRNVVSGGNQQSEEMQYGSKRRCSNVLFVVPSEEPGSFLGRSETLWEVDVHCVHLCKEGWMGLCVL
jgi:hypothetical protein